MAPIVDDSAGEIRFLTRASSHKADEVEQDRHVNLTFVGPDRAYVSVEGTARMSQDRDLIKRCWSDAAQAWLPEGPDGADVALIRVEPRRADVWDLKSNAIDRSFEIKAAARDGRVPDVGSQKTVRP
jgi:general stress protein 26